jgi:ribosomal protein S12 methylthiotransferase accessory factor
VIAAPPRPSDLSVLADAADQLVDERVGVVNSVFNVDLPAGAPALFHVAARAANTGAFAAQDNFFNTGGAATERPRALAKAVGEAVERYCAAIFDADDFPLFAYRDAPGPAVAPEEFALYSDDQYASPGFPWAPFAAGTPVRWTEALDLGARAGCWVPACRVFIPYHYYLASGDTPIDQPISTGMACHASPAAAARSAICEAVERDAFTICWQAMLAPPQVRLETLPDDSYDIVERFERARIGVTMFDLRLDHGIPTVLSVARGDTPTAPAFVFAAASAADPADAVRSSLEELAHTHRYSQWIKGAMAPLAKDPGHRNVSGQEHHLNFAADHGNAAAFEFLFESEEAVTFDEIASIAGADPRDDVAALVERIQGVGARVLVADVTSDDIRAVGLTVVRAIVPQFHPLHMSHGLRSLGGRRLWEVPQALGYEGITPAGGDNPAPHPYP